MKKNVKKVFCLLLSFILIFSAVITAFAVTSEEADTHLQFNKDGTFKIMQITDMQDLFPMRDITKAELRKALDTCKPDLLILTGDNISSTTLITGYTVAAIHEFMSIFEEYGIPVAATFGNHDDERTLAGKEIQLAVYRQYKCFVGCEGEDFGDTNLGTYYIPVYASDNKYNMIFNLWVIDSGTYDEYGYACTTKEQIAWYKETSEKLEEAYGRKIPSMMFQHIIVPEIWDALEETDAPGENTVSHDGKYYTLPEGATGCLHETPCPPVTNNGQFDAAYERGDVLAMFFGHDHTNTFDINYRGIRLINTAGAGYNSYNGYNNGVRMITLYEDNPWQFDTEEVTYFDLFEWEDDEARYLFKAYSDTTDTGTKFAAFFKYIFIFILNRLGIVIK